MQAGTYITRWTDEQLRRLRQLHEAGWAYKEIADDLGCNIERVRGRLAWDKKTSEQLAARRARINKLRRGEETSSRIHPTYDTVAGRPKPEQLAERDRRRAAPRTLTQEFFGDPPAGYSALDRKRAEVGL